MIKVHKYISGCILGIILFLAGLSFFIEVIPPNKNKKLQQIAVCEDIWIKILEFHSRTERWPNSMSEIQLDYKEKILFLRKGILGGDRVRYELRDYPSLYYYFVPNCFCGYRRWTTDPVFTQPLFKDDPLYKEI